MDVQRGLTNPKMSTYELKRRRNARTAVLLLETRLCLYDNMISGNVYERLTLRRHAARCRKSNVGYPIVYGEYSVSVFLGLSRFLFRFLVIYLCFIGGFML